MFLDYAGLRVHDLDRSIASYTGAAGLSEVNRGTMDHGGAWVLPHDRASGQRLELNWYPSGSQYATPYSSGEGLDHLGFRVADLPGAVVQLTQAGAKLVEEIRDGGKVVLAYLADPDGVWLELIPTEML